VVFYFIPTVKITINLVEPRERTVAVLGSHGTNNGKFNANTQEENKDIHCFVTYYTYTLGLSWCVI